MVVIPHYHLASPPPILTEAWAFMVGEYFRMTYHLCFPSNVVMAGAGSFGREQLIIYLHRLGQYEIA